MTHPNAYTFVPAWLQSPADELYPIFVDGLKKLCLTDHVAASKHGIVKNRSYIVFDMSKHMFKDLRTTIRELEIGKTHGADHVIAKCTLYMTLKTMRDDMEVNVFKIFDVNDDIEEFIKDWEKVPTIIGPIAGIVKCVLFEGGKLEWETYTTIL